MWTQEEAVNHKIDIWSTSCTIMKRKKNVKNICFTRRENRFIQGSICLRRNCLMRLFITSAVYNKYTSWNLYKMVTQNQLCKYIGDKTFENIIANVFLKISDL